MRSLIGKRNSFVASVKFPAFLATPCRPVRRIGTSPSQKRDVCISMNGLSWSLAKDVQPLLAFFEIAERKQLCFFTTTAAPGFSLTIGKIVFSLTRRSRPEPLRKVAGESLSNWRGRCFRGRVALLSPRESARLWVPGGTGRITRTSCRPRAHIV